VARIRTIKPDYWTDERVGECSVSARLLFIACWNFADDYGGLDRSSKQLKAQAFPYDAIDCEPLVQELLGGGLLVEYVKDGKTYLHIKGFRKHQKVEKPAKPRIPVYDDSFNSRGVLTEPSPTSSGLFLGREGKGTKERQLAAKRPSVGARFAEFWAAYPKKVKKKDAEKVWQSKRLDATADVLLADIKRRGSEDRRWLGGFVPDPPTYLRGERWTDAIEPVTKNGNGQHAADAAAKERGQILDLASMFGMEIEGDEEWASFKARVERANTRRLENLGRST
jgi:hypothetical protein